MLPGGLDVAEPPFQIAQADQGVGLAQPVAVQLGCPEGTVEPTPQQPHPAANTHEVVTQQGQLAKQAGAVPLRPGKSMFHLLELLFQPVVVARFTLITVSGHRYIMAGLSLGQG